MDPRHPLLRLARDAYREGFDRPAALVRSGGTIPVVTTLQEALRAPVALMGFASPDDRMHGPDERFRLESFERGIRTSIGLLERLGRLTARSPSERPRVAA
jgi:acetylornithine deacetylase/succinyl-diaminopimelate desuccinylase-like protein